MAQGYPRVSTVGNEHWYYVKYLRSNNVLEEKGEKAKVPHCRSTGHGRRPPVMEGR